jgi:hypothetical protein
MLTAASRRQFRRKTWYFLNSQFGLWFLSACVLGLISFSYTEWQKEKEKTEATAKVERERLEAAAKVEKERLEAAAKIEKDKLDRLTGIERERKEMVSKLDREISFRYSIILRQLAEIHEKTTPAVLDSNGQKIAEAIATLFIGGRNSLYPEFEKLSMIALYSELLRNSPPSDQSAVDADIVTLAGEPFRKVEMNSAYEVGKAIQRRLFADRWRQYGFYYVDCTPPRQALDEPLPDFNPFC